MTTDPTFPERPGEIAVERVGDTVLITALHYASGTTVWSLQDPETAYAFAARLRELAHEAQRVADGEDLDGSTTLDETLSQILDDPDGR